MLIHWDMKPEIFSVGPVTVRWYGLLFALGFIVGFRIMEKIFKREHRNLLHLDSLLIYLILGTTIGARLGHCLFYEPELYLSNPLRILYIWEGGLASHGGTLGNLFAMYLFVRKYPEYGYLWLVDRLSIPVALAASFIRLGNVMNSEILGLPTDQTWGVIFERVDQVARHPAQVYESVSYFLTFLLMGFLYYKTDTSQYRGRMFGIFLICVFGARLVIEKFKENQVPFEAYLPLNMGQILSIPFIIAGVGLIVFSQSRRVQTPSR